MTTGSYILFCFASMTFECSYTFFAADRCFFVFSAPTFIFIGTPAFCSGAADGSVMLGTNAASFGFTIDVVPVEGERCFPKEAVFFSPAQSFIN